MQQKPPSRKHSVSKTSNNWKKEHFDDQYVKQSWQDGYRSRASYKLLELDEKDKLFRNGMIDLGAAPGGWSQIAAEKVGPEGVVIASDILEMDALAGVDFIQGDFTEERVLNAILERLGNRPVDLVMSDMAPNMSGNNAVDQPRAEHRRAGLQVELHQPVEVLLAVARAVKVTRASRGSTCRCATN